MDLRSALHLHRVASLWEVLVTEPGAVRGQVQSPASEVPLLEKGHLREEILNEYEHSARNMHSYALFSVLVHAVIS